MTPDADSSAERPDEAGKETEAVPMNRAERRAAAKGKKTAPGPSFGQTRTGVHQPGRPGGTPGQTRLPRTGHKGA